jgi:large subunit ribosomal protein L21
MAREITKKTAPKKTVETAPKETKKVAKVKKPAPDTFYVISTGGKQYKVASGDVLKIEKIKDLKKGDSIVFDQVLFSFDGSNAEIGTPTVSGMKVTGEVIEEGRAKKVTVIKYKQKSRYFKERGHRQPYLKVRIS